MGERIRMMNKIKKVPTHVDFIYPAVSGFLEAAAGTHTQDGSKTLNPLAGEWTKPGETNMEWNHHLNLVIYFNIYVFL